MGARLEMKIPGGLPPSTPLELPTPAGATLTRCSACSIWFTNYEPLTCHDSGVSITKPNNIPQPGDPLPAAPSSPVAPPKERSVRDAERFRRRLGEALERYVKWEKGIHWRKSATTALRSGGFAFRCLARRTMTPRASSTRKSRKMGLRPSCCTRRATRVASWCKESLPSTTPTKMLASRTTSFVGGVPAVVDGSSSEADKAFELPKLFPGNCGGSLSAPSHSDDQLALLTVQPGQFLGQGEQLGSKFQGGRLPRGFHEIEVSMAIKWGKIEINGASSRADEERLALQPKPPCVLAGFNGAASWSRRNDGAKLVFISSRGTTRRERRGLRFPKGRPRGVSICPRRHGESVEVPLSSLRNSDTLIAVV